MAKKCNKCSEWKEATRFSADKRNSDGLQGICNSCKDSDKRLRREERAKTNNYRVVIEKECNSCKTTKLIEFFYKDKATSDGHSSICKHCKSTRVNEWREVNKDKYNEYQRVRNASDYQKNRLRRYRLTPEQHAQMLVDQNHVCAICLKPPNGKRPLVVDHDHQTGKVRGLLCYGCNRLIVVLDNHPYYDKMMAYKKGS